MSKQINSSGRQPGGTRLQTAERAASASRPAAAESSASSSSIPSSGSSWDSIYQRRARNKERRKRQRHLIMIVGFAALFLVLLISFVVHGRIHDAATNPVSPEPTPKNPWQDFFLEKPVEATPWGIFWPERPKSIESSEDPSAPLSTDSNVKTVAQSAAVDDSYFADAVFIGNSRTLGFLTYAGLDGAKCYAAQGLNVKTVFTDAFLTVDGRKCTVIDALKRDKSFKKVYIMLGLNELGWVSLDAFQKQYEEVIRAVRAVKGDALIYVQSLLPVSAAKSASSDIYNNERVQMFNDRVKAAAKNQNAYYLNVAEAVQDADGVLPADASADGVHLKKAACLQWLEYLKTHTVPMKTSEA